MKPIFVLKYEFKNYDSVPFGWAWEPAELKFNTLKQVSKAYAQYKRSYSARNVEVFRVTKLKMPE